MSINETVYVDGYISKHTVNNEATHSLVDGVVSAYDFNPAMESNKTYPDGTTKIKRYVWGEAKLSYDYESANVKKAVGGYVGDESESYFILLAPEGIQELSSHYSLPMPVIGDEYIDLMVNFASWSMNAAAIGYKNPVVASVKFDADTTPYMLKLYRGNYEPTQTEIDESKAHWDALNNGETK